MLHTRKRVYNVSYVGNTFLLRQIKNFRCKNTNEKTIGTYELSERYDKIITSSVIITHKASL